MAVNDRITSERVCTIYRRINALENLRSYTLDATATTAAYPSGEFHGGPTQHIFYCTNGSGIKKNNHTLTNETEFIPEGTGTDEVETSGVTPWLGYNEATDILYVSDPQGFRAFDNTGSEIWKNTDDTSGYAYGIAGLDNSECVAFNASNVVLYHFDSSGNRTTFLDISSGNKFAWNIRQYSATEVAFTYQDNDTPSNDELRIYESDGTLNSTQTSRYTGVGTSKLADTFEGVYATPNAKDILVGDGSGDTWGTSDPAFFRKDGTFIKAIDFSTSAYRGYLVNDDGDLYLTSAATPNAGNVKRYTEGSSQTTWYHYPRAGEDTGKTSLGTVDFGLTVPANNALQNKRVHYFNLRDARTAIEGIITSYVGEIASGTTTGATTFKKLIDSGQNFTSTVTANDTVVNVTDGTSATVSTVDSDTQLTLLTDIMATGEDYQIFTPWEKTGSVNNNIFTVTFGGGAEDWPSGTVSHGERVEDAPWDEIEQILTKLEGSYIE